jgi:hypothetical protein
MIKKEAEAWLNVRKKLEENPEMARGLALLGPSHELFQLIRKTHSDQNYYDNQWTLGGCDGLFREILEYARIVQKKANEDVSAYPHLAKTYHGLLDLSAFMSHTLRSNLCREVEKREITCSDEDARILYRFQKDIENHKKWLDEYEKQVVQYRNAPVMGAAQAARVAQIMSKAASGGPLTAADISVVSSFDYAPIIFFNTTEKAQVVKEMEAYLSKARANYKELTAYRQKIIDRITQKCPSLVLYSPNQLVSSSTLSGTSTSSTQEPTTSSTQESTQSQSSGEITATAQARASGSVPVLSSWAMCISRFPNDPEGQRQCVESMQRQPESGAEDVSTPAAVGAGAGIGTFLLVGALAFAAYWAYTNWFKKK